MLTSEGTRRWSASYLVIERRFLPLRRPTDGPDPGHAGESAALTGARALLELAGRAGTCAALLVGAVAVSRVPLGVRYLSDVAADVAPELAWIGAAALRVNLRRSAGSPTSVSHRSLARKD